MSRTRSELDTSSKKVCAITIQLLLHARRSIYLSTGRSSALMITEISFRVSEGRRNVLTAGWVDIWMSVSCQMVSFPTSYLGVSTSHLM